MEDLRTCGDLHFRGSDIMTLSVNELSVYRHDLDISLNNMTCRHWFISVDAGSNNMIMIWVPVTAITIRDVIMDVLTMCERPLPSVDHILHTGVTKDEKAGYVDLETLVNLIQKSDKGD